MFPIYVHVPLYSNMCAVDRSDYIGKTGYHCKLPFDVCLFNGIIWKPYIDEMRMIPFKTAGMAQLGYNGLCLLHATSNNNIVVKNFAINA